MEPSTQKDKEAMQKVPYLNAIGALNYLAITTRPDISYTVGHLARYSKNLGLKHWKAVRHLMRYIKGTAHLALTFSPSGSGTIFET